MCVRGRERRVAGKVRERERDGGREKERGRERQRERWRFVVVGYARANQAAADALIGWGHPDDHIL